MAERNVSQVDEIGTSRNERNRGPQKHTPQSYDTGIDSAAAVSVTRGRNAEAVL